jgi:pyruvate kinase
MRRRRKIKILATLGPASNNSEIIEELFRAGADIFRINMSHTSHDAMRALVATIREVETKYDRPIGILADLQGPKLRIGSFEAGSVQLPARAELYPGQRPGAGQRRAGLPPPSRDLRRA